MLSAHIAPSRASSGLRALRFDGRLRLDTSLPEPRCTETDAVLRLRQATLTHLDLLAGAGDLAFSGILGSRAVATIERVHPHPGGAPDGLGARVLAGLPAPCGVCELCHRGLHAHCPQRRVPGLHAADGCLADLFAMNLDSLTEIPRSVTDDAALFAPDVAAVLHAARALGTPTPRYVTILGDGVEGLIAAQVLARRLPGLRLLGEQPDRFAITERWGVRHRHLAEAGRRQDQDVVIETTGRPEMLEAACALCRPSGTVVLMPPGAPLPMGAFRAARPPAPISAASDAELTILCSRGGHLREGLAYIATHGLDVVSLLGQRLRLSDGVRAYAIAVGDPGKRVRIEP